MGDTLDGGEPMSGRRLRDAAERGDGAAVKQELGSGANVNDSVRRMRLCHTAHAIYLTKPRRTRGA